MKALVYRIKLTTPAILRKMGNDPNGSETLLYIPGSSIRGSLIARYLKKYKLEDPMQDEQFRKLFFSDHVRFLHAYPNYKKTFRMIPGPFSIFTEKNKRSDLLYDFSFEDTDYDYFYEDTKDRRFDESTQWIKKILPFVHCRLNLEEESLDLNYYTPKTVSRTHIQIDREGCRPLGEVNEEMYGTMYHYSAIDAGEEFIGAILFDDEYDGMTEVICDLLPKNDDLHLGKSLRSGYGGRGRCTILNELKDKDDLLNWTEGMSIDGRFFDYDKNYLSILLTSDVILNSDSFSVEIFSKVLEKAIGLDIFLRFISERSFIQTGLVGSYNTKWHLPQPQKPAFLAGSVFTFEIIGTKLNKLKDACLSLEWKGIGCRRNEGYGRLLFGIFGQCPEIKEPNNSKEPEEIHIENHLCRDDQLTATVSKNIIINQLKIEVQNSALRITNNAINIPPNSLLGRMREYLLLYSKRNELYDRLNQLSKEREEKNKPALKKLEDCILSDQNKTDLLKWLKKIFEPPSTIRPYIWSILPLTQIIKDYSLEGLSDFKNYILQDQDLQFEFEKRLVEQVLVLLSYKKEGVLDES